MFQLGGATKIYLAAGATDMRKSFDTLCGVVRCWHGKNAAVGGIEQEPVDPISGHLFVFCNRRRDRIKVLYFDGTGLWVCAKRLERGSFSWPAPNEQGAGPDRHVISQHELALLLGGVDLSRTVKRRWWRKE